MFGTGTGAPWQDDVHQVSHRQAQKACRSIGACLLQAHARAVPGSITVPACRSLWTCSLLAPQRLEHEMLWRDTHEHEMLWRGASSIPRPETTSWSGCRRPAAFYGVDHTSTTSPRQLTIFPAGEQHSLDFNGLRNFLSSLDSSRRDPPTELEVIAVMIMTMCNMHSISSSFIERSSIGTGHNPPLTRAPRCFWFFYSCV
jgi:hypothetical protein